MRLGRCHENTGEAPNLNTKLEIMADSRFVSLSRDCFRYVFFGGCW